MRVISSQQAADLLEDGMTVAASGFGGCCHPEAITAAVEERFLASGKPRNLTLLFAASTGDRQTRGMGHFGYEGLVACVIAGGWRGTPRLGKLAIEEKIEAHCWPQGVIAQLYRAIAAGQPGVVTHIGLGSFMDPLHGGGRMNATTPRPLVERVSLRGKEWLLYPSMPLDCVLLRGTTADEDGNITLEDEAFPLDVLAMAQAGRNSGGIVVVQVKQIAERGSLQPNDVRIPAALVDYVVVCDDPAQHGISFAETDNIAYTGRVRMAASRLLPAPLSVDKIIQRRAFLELAPLNRPTINLGIGIAAGIGRIASEEGFDDYTVTIESGVIGGVPAEELSFGAAVNPTAIVPQASQFDFYDGGGLDIAFLGMAEVDRHGAVNVSRFNNSIVGVGGFTNISQTAKHVVYLGAFSAGGAEIAVADGRLDIVQDGRLCKIVEAVDQISSSPAFAPEGQSQLVVTERAVFRVIGGCLTLTEFAPGIDLAAHVLDRLPKGIAVSDQLKQMDARLFSTPAMKDFAP
ncbi:acyl CoA:acetate/3-ketoacid CoA transferase [Rhizobium leguminosarum]|uniref:acyl CoA:acetate/3-ketoacid CoA transferase n=1 Tax=Rhizobium leguminosarum TaxID=384 RepID=UPI001440F29C|nr:CoA-transferase [Rhizobium leguminosarum]MBY5864470.1 acyl CoA:acetate/3-ketoacid CoA transferase [Rhizobium leguminosarum]NKM03486.1 acyl CoA:acetate/3-ketoacid CoA transferase [Rhizobium leguminosarum bv. viciae]